MLVYFPSCDHAKRNYYSLSVGLLSCIFCWFISTIVQMDDFLVWCLAECMVTGEFLHLGFWIMALSILEYLGLWIIVLSLEYLDLWIMVLSILEGAGWRSKRTSSSSSLRSKEHKLELVSDTRSEDWSRVEPPPPPPPPSRRLRPAIDLPSPTATLIHWPLGQGSCGLGLAEQAHSAKCWSRHSRLQAGYSSPSRSSSPSYPMLISTRLAACLRLRFQSHIPPLFLFFHDVVEPLSIGLVIYDNSILAIDHAVCG